MEFGDQRQRQDLEARAGQFGANRSQKPNGTAPRFEDVGNLIVTGGNRDWQENYRRNQVLGSISYFKDGWSGSHDFKVGGEIFRTTATEILGGALIPATCCTSCGTGLPSEVYLFQTPSRLDSGLWTVLCLRQRLLAGQQPPDTESGTPIRPLSRVPSRAGAPGRPVQPNGADVPGERQPDRLECCRTQDWAYP